MELKVQHRVGAYFGNVLRKARAVDFSDLADWLYDAMEAGVITEKEKDEALRTDLLVRGVLRSSPDTELFLAVEISYVVDKGDILRAVDRAKIIEKVVKHVDNGNMELKKKCLPAVIGKSYTEGAKELVHKLNLIAV